MFVSLNIYTQIQIKSLYPFFTLSQAVCIQMSDYHISLTYKIN